MRYYKLTTSGENIRELRKKYKIRQEELTGNKITRNLISIIENGKTKLTANTANIIAENLNIALNKRNIDLKIDSNELLVSVEKQIQWILNDFNNILATKQQEFINGSFIGALVDVEKILNLYNLNEDKLKIYKTIGDLYDKSKDFYNAYTYYIKAYESNKGSLNDLDLALLIQNIGYCYVRLGRYKEAIDFNNLASAYNDKMSLVLKCDISYNNALSYKHLKKYQEALNELDGAEKELSSILDNDSLRKFSILTLKANCLREMKRYSSAVSIYTTVLANIDDKNIENKILIFCNFMETYMELEDTKNLKVVLNKCLKLMKKYSSLDNKPYECGIYNDIALAASFINDTDVATEYYYKSLNLARKNNDSEMILCNLDCLLDIFDEAKNYTEINSIRDQFCEMISLNKISSINLFTLKLVGLYNSCGDIESANNLINFCIKHNK